MFSSNFLTPSLPLVICDFFDPLSFELHVINCYAPGFHSLSRNVASRKVLKETSNFK